MAKIDKILDSTDILDNIKFGELSEVGVVKSISEGIVRASGLHNAFLNEIVKFDSGDIGTIRALEEFEVVIVLFNKNPPISAGTHVRRTKKKLTISVSNSILGRVVDVFCNPIDGGPAIIAAEEMPVEAAKAPTMMKRAEVSKPLLTGTMVVDTMISIGRGQRELILGGRKTGKTSLAVGMIINQKQNYLTGKPVYCFYVAIGQSQSSVASVVKRLEEAGAMEYTAVICSFAADASGNKFIAPYVGCAIAEYFMGEGHDCLIIYDDLSKHAKANRHIARLMGAPGGRDAYPADSFSTHARLLERAACTKKGGSITAIPIIEIAGDSLDAYIPTNVISITDGQIVLNEELTHNGMPPINIGQSVSRIGTKAQSKVMKEVAGKMKLDFLLYIDTKRFSALAADQLDAEQKEILQNGEELSLLFNQDLDQLYTLSNQVILLLAQKAKLLRDVDEKQVKNYIESFLEYVECTNPALSEEIEQDVMPDNMEKTVQELVDAFKKSYKAREFYQSSSAVS